MAARSVQIQFTNATDFPLNLIASHLCHGKWTNDGAKPPQQVAARSMVSWESQSDGILTGTQGWVKYKLAPSSGNNEQVLVSWDNPYVPATGTPWIVPSESIYNISPPCGNDSTGGFASKGPSSFPDTTMFQTVVTGAGTGPNTDAFDLLKLFGVLAFSGAAFLEAVGLAIFDLSGTNVILSFSLQVEQKGSVAQALPLNYDRSKGLRPLATEAKTSSIRKLIGA